MNMATTNLPAATPARARNLLVAVGFGIAGILMYFGGLFGVYLRERSQVRSSGGTWIPDKAHIELTPPGMIIWTLLISVAVMQWAVYSIKRDDRQHALLAVGTTLVMGAMVLVQHGWQLSQMNLIADEGPTTAATLIYTIVGSYMVAFVIGMIFVALMGFRALAGQYSSRQTDGIVAASLYWYSLVFVYFIIWIAVFIAK
ncbi:MAG: cytochrome c oxidase subunit 3 [Acidimicrobiales bacterium]|nr:cytochrome c oxidase subunit 3 [Acidimicrobiales bacterium]|tara:strand:+ start:1380 stop:1979 length:600 start_codon:yes stop_codon:yes gene_type:complete